MLTSVTEPSTRCTARPNPLGVAEYQLVESLPPELETSLPSVEQIERELAGERIYEHDRTARSETRSGTTPAWNRIKQMRSIRREADCPPRQSGSPPRPSATPPLPHRQRQR